MNKEIKNKPCSSGKFKRLNYYEGMLLTEQDFKDEQNYFREKMKLHNRLHGFGVVWGLEITKKRIKEGNGCTDKFFIEPGFALDCAGNEIIICHPYRLPIDEIIEEFSQGCPPLKEKVCLSISLKYIPSTSLLLMILSSMVTRLLSRIVPSNSMPLSLLSLIAFSSMVTVLSS